MLDNDLEKYFEVRQLSDYRTDWPGGKKGCLFLLPFHTRSGDGYRLLIVDFPWRKGANWEDYPKLLPEEKALLQKESRSDGYSWIRLNNFSAILIAAAIDHKSLTDDDVLKLWKVYKEKNAHKYAYQSWPTMGYVHDYFGFKNHLTDNFKSILDIVLPASNGQQSAHEYICKLWESAMREWIVSVVKEMTPERQLFDTNFELKIDDTREVDVPVRVYDCGEAEDNEGEVVVHVDDHNYYEEGTETYTSDDLAVCKDENDRLVIRCYAPEYIERKGCEFDYDEDNETYYATDFEDETSSFFTTYYDEVPTYGLTTLIIQYCAAAMLLRACESMDETPEILRRLYDYAPQRCLQDVDISITRKVYDMYFRRFSQQYSEAHKEDCDYICLNENEQTIECAKAALKDEQEKIQSSKAIYDYLTAEQGERLEKYTGNYLKYLEGVISGLLAKTGGKYILVDGGQQTGPIKKEEELLCSYLWPSYTAQATDEDKRTFEDFLLQTCRSKKRSMTKDIKNYLKAKKDAKIIHRPDQINTEYEWIQRFGYPYVEKSYYNG